MKYGLAFLLALSALPLTTASGSTIEALVVSNCVKAIMSSSAQVNRTQVKAFQLAKNGSGYAYSGLDENKHIVTCKAAADGHVTWIDG
jgi:hypothetical protein